MSDKPKFDPNQPFEPAASSQPTAKPKFDPEKPFEPSDTAQPGVQAIGSPEGPQAQEPDWVDRTKAVAEGALEHLPMGVGPAVKIAKLLGQTAPVQAAGRLLSVPGNVARTGLAAGLESILPGKNQVTMQDGMNALTGSAPGVGDQIIRKYPSTDIGVGIPGTNNKRLTSRDIMNLLGNVATDPLMYGGLQKLGKKMYDSTISPIEIEGQRFGKADVGNTLNENGVWNPLSMREKVQSVVDQNMTKTGTLEAQADATGTQGDISKAMEQAQANVDAIKSTARAGSPQAKLAESMQAEINNHLQNNLPEGAQAQPTSSRNLSQWKTDAYDAAKKNAYDTLNRSDAWQKFYKAQGAGLKGETEATIEKALGPEAAAEYQKANADTGKLLSTGKAQARVQSQAQRLANSVTTPVPNGTEGAAMGLATALKEGDPLAKLGSGLTAMLVQKGAKAAQLAAMPTGYVMRNMPREYTSALAIKNASPWALQGDDNGKK